MPVIFEMNRQASLEVLDLGADAQPVAIIDGLAASPDTWRERGSGSGYEFRGDFYPGRRKHVDSCYFNDVGGPLGAVMRSIFGCSNFLRVDRALYSIVSTEADDLSLAQRIPHFDDCSNNSFAMVHYLSQGNFGGTGFYRHRSTGLFQVPIARQADYLSALTQDFEIFGKPPSAYINGSTDIFEQAGRVDFRYNRAVIYRGNQLHCPIIPQDLVHPGDPSCGRLTIAVFFRAN